MSHFSYVLNVSTDRQEREVMSVSSHNRGRAAQSKTSFLPVAHRDTTPRFSDIFK